MKKWFILLYLVLSVSLSGCLPIPADLQAAAKEVLPKSTITKESCYLCGPDKKVDFVKRPHDTLMLLCLDTWELKDLRMYDYDSVGNDANYSGATMLHSANHPEGSCDWSFASNSGYHTCEIDIVYGDNSVLKSRTLAKQLCPDCLEKIFSSLNFKNTDAYCDVLYDTATGDVYPISQISSPYHISDYWVHVDHNPAHNADSVYIVYNPDSTK